MKVFTLTQNELLDRISTIENQIAELPVGSITKKNVNGKDYYYLRVSTEGKRTETYIPEEEAVVLRPQIEERKSLEKKLRALKRKAGSAAVPSKATSSPNKAVSPFTSNIRTGLALRPFASFVKNYRKRECYKQLRDYIYGEIPDKVFILYGSAQNW